MENNPAMAPNLCSSMFLTRNLHGLHVNLSNMNQALREVETLLESEGCSFVCFFEANLLHLALKDSRLREVLNQAALIYPDGIAVAKLLQHGRKEPVERVPGPSFLLKACEYGQEHHWRHFFLGGAEGVAENLAKNLKAKFPDLEVAGTYCPPFREMTADEETMMKKQIEESEADLLWVGLGGPKQEYWMQRHLKTIQVPVMLGVGAAFDFHSGNRPWAPAWIRKMGMEWLFRMLSGGRRTFVRNIKCVCHIGYVLCIDRLTWNSRDKRIDSVRKPPRGISGTEYRD